MKEIGLKERLIGEKLSSPNTLTGVAMMAALYTILSFFTLKISATFEFGFSFIALLVCGMLYGPVASGIAGVVGDTLGFFISPNGDFFPGFMLSAFVMGFVYGLILYKRPVTVKRTAFAVGIISIICNLVLTPLWLNMMYGTSLIAAPRVIRTLVMYPINTVISYSILKLIRNYRTNQA